MKASRLTTQRGSLVIANQVVDFEEILGDNHAAENTLIIAEQCHIRATGDGDPKGEPSASEPEVGLLGPKESHRG